MYKMDASAYWLEFQWMILPVAVDPTFKYVYRVCCDSVFRQSVPIIHNSVRESILTES